MVNTNRLTCDGSLSFSSATLSDVGSVAFDDAVENAISIASSIPEKNVRGLIPPRTLTSAP